jgi:hypothetical protein
MPGSPAELVAFFLFGVAIVVVPAVLACALFSLARTDRRPPPGHAAVAARRSPRRQAARPVGGRPRFRDGPNGRRFRHG